MAHIHRTQNERMNEQRKGERDKCRMDALDKFSKSKNLCCNILGKEIKLWRLVGKLIATKHGN